MKWKYIVSTAYDKVYDLMLHSLMPLRRASDGFKYLHQLEFCQLCQAVMRCDMQ